MFCPKCGFYNDDLSEVCDKCETILKSGVYCVKCGSYNDDDSTQCVKCHEGNKGGIFCQSCGKLNNASWTYEGIKDVKCTRCNAKLYEGLHGRNFGTTDIITKNTIDSIVNNSDRVSTTQDNYLDRVVCTLIVLIVVMCGLYAWHIHVEFRRDVEDTKKEMEHYNSIFDEYIELEKERAGELW